MVWRVPKIAHSLGLRLLLLLVGTVGVVLAVHSVINYRATRSDLLGFVHRSANSSSDLIARATHDGMLLNRLDEVQDTIEHLADGPAVAVIRVFDKTGAVVLSANQEEIGQRVALDSDTCASCHGGEHIDDQALLQRSQLTRLPDESDEVLRHLAVILNEPSCASANCHATPQEERVLGVLDVEMSMRPVEATLRASLARIFWTSVILMLVIGLGSAVYIHRIVHQPVIQLQEGTQRIAGGDLDTRIETRHGSSEFSDLALAFNKMAHDLSGAQAELKAWSQTLEDKVVEKSEELQRTQKQVLHMEKMASLGKLSATVAHELNNPISGMLNYTRLIQRYLAEDGLDEESRGEINRFLSLLQKECVRCGKIVTNLLLFARPRGAEMEQVDVNEVVERSLNLVEHHLHVSGVELNSELLEGNSVIICDSGQLQQALVALLVNAVEAMGAAGQGGGTLRVRVAGDEDRVSIDISDTGVGIPSEVLPRIFEPFFSTKDKESGVGLGLAVVYGIVSRHAGTIDVRPGPDGGTTFHIVLPRNSKPEPYPRNEAEPSGGLSMGRK